MKVQFWYDIHTIYFCALEPLYGILYAASLSADTPYINDTDLKYNENEHSNFS